MVVLKKIKSATLVEVIVATVLIVLIFMISSLLLNSLVLHTISKNTHVVETRMNALEYELQNGLLPVPYQENYSDWKISIQQDKSAHKSLLVLLASNELNGKIILRKRSYDTP